MKQRTILLIIIVLVMGLTGSCMIREYDNPDDYNKPIEQNKPLTFEFFGVSLKFDLSNMKELDNIDLDYLEICNNHLVSYNNDYHGEVKQFDHLLMNEDCFEDNRKPSIAVKISSLFYGDTTKVFSKDDIRPYALMNVPNIKDYKSHTLTFKSIVTEKNALQVVWEDSSTGVDGWEELSISGNTIHVDFDFESLSVIVKSGLNKSRGDFAARNNGNSYGIIPNTVNEEEYEELMEEDSELLLEEYCEEDSPVFSPFYLRPIYSGGWFKKNMRWRIPTILTKRENN